MGVGEASVNNIMSGIENTGGVKQHNHKKKLRQRFDIIKKLGQGTFGKVQLGINKETGQEVAIKTIKKSKIESDADLVRIRREIQIMSSVQHPNIIHIYEVFENREKMVLVMEYAAGGELYDYLSERKVLQEEEARRIFRQIATACYYCHKHKICHRDLKLENILLDENNNAKIADFGLSNVFDDQRLLNTFCGSPLYASPEIVKGTPYHGPEVDCWSLGVLLYTLVYGAMPFDGSNFKRLVKQISQGDYYEPSKPSPASPLIRDMLTVNPRNRANIEKICSHWWVNETYDDNCLEISEELANQTPVRLDVLLSLAPPPPQLESDKLVVTGDASEKGGNTEGSAPVRSQSVGSLMEFTSPEKRIIDLINEDKVTPKRKLESTVSTDRVNLDKGRKDKIIKEHTVADITVHGSAIRESPSEEDARMAEVAPIIRSLTQTISKELLNRSSTQTISKEPSKEMEIETNEETIDPSLQGAACAEIIQESEQKEASKQPKLKKNLTTSSTKVLEGINEIPSQENVTNLDKENLKEVKQEPAVKQKSEEKPAPKKKIVKKKVLTDKNDNSISKPVANESKQAIKEKEPTKESQKEEKSEEVAQAPQKPIERRRSRIFEAAEKFQNMMAPSEPKAPLAEKPKKIIIPGISVDGFKKEFERKASLTSTSPTKVKTAVSNKKSVSIDKQTSEEEEASPEPEESLQPKDEDAAKPETMKTDDDRKERVKNAVNIISSVLDKEGTRKSKSRPCMMRKPPVPFGVSGRSASGNIGMITTPLSPPIQTLGPKPFVKTNFEKPEVKQVQEEPVVPVEDKTSTAEISLKSATLPRRKTTKAQIQLNYPVPKPAQMEFKTEVAHNVEAGPKTEMQRSEVVVPVSGKSNVGFRKSFTEAEPKGSKERIIPIAFEKTENGRENVQSPPVKPPVARTYQTQKSTNSQRSDSLSRQSTQESDSETVSTGEPIKKSPREYIIPIAVEGGGYVTPRAGSLEPSDTASTTSTMTNRSKSKFGSRTRRMASLLSDRDSEDESSPFCTLNRHSSFGKDSDTEDSKRDMFHMHRLRSTRPKKSTIEHADSVSSGEEDDDEGFEILTAENLFSTLLSRVRDLTQRLNVDDGVRPGFPSSRLLSHFDHGTNFWNRMDNPLSRHSSLGRTFSRPSSNTSTTHLGGVPWRRSVSRDLASDIESVFNEPNTQTVRVPRGDNMSKNENLNLADLDLNKLKLSDEDALALSYLTPGLSRRIQKQLLAQLTPSEVRKLHRTLSSRTAEENQKEPKPARRSTDRMSSTLPRKYSIDKDNNKTISDELDEGKHSSKNVKSFLPVKSSGFREEYRPSYEFNVRSSSIGAEPRGDYKFSYRKPTRINRSLSIREPGSYLSSKSSDLHSPDSSISENVSRNDDSSYRDSLSSRYSDSSVSRPYSKYSSDSSYSKYVPNAPTQSSLDLKSDTKKPSSRRISRFLRPDFFDGPKEEPKKENVFLKEKKEREMETQKVLKEIRDKRKGRHNLRSDRSSSREKELSKERTPALEEITKKKEQNNKYIGKTTNSISNNEDIPNEKLQTVHDYVNVPAQSSTPAKETSVMLSNGTDKTTDTVHDYVNVKAAENSTPVVKKEQVSRIIRPKSYPTESVDNKLKVSPEKTVKDSKISRLKRGFTKQAKEKTKEDKNEENKHINEEDKGHKNKILQSIEKKFEKFRNSNSAAGKDPEKVKVLQEKKSNVENAIKRLREQSLPPANLEPCTESGLIKRAVSVEDLTGSKPLQASRKSVTKILGLFKKYEEQDKKKPVKKNKSKENGKNTVTKTSNKNDSDKTNESVINQAEIENANCDNHVVLSDSSHSEKVQKKERPRSLLLNKEKHFQNAYIGAKSDSLLIDNNEKESKIKSKLPVNSFRRSLNLDSLPETPRFYKNPSRTSVNENNTEQRPDKKNLKLDLSRVPLRKTEPTVVVSAPSTSSYQLNGFEDNAYSRENRNSLATTDDSSTLLSPGDEYLSCDSWSACSDFHHINDLHSPTSYNGHSMYSGDENESVIDRIRRKSFYTRFNEKKRPRKPSIAHNYKDLDYCKPTSDYSSLDRYRSPSVARTFSYSSYKPEPTTREYKPYTRSASVLNDYVNVPSSYQTYNSKIGRPSVRGLYSDPEDNALDDLLSTAKSRIHSPTMHRSSLSRGSSVSPVHEQYFVDRPSSSILSPTNSEPI